MQIAHGIICQIAIINHGINCHFKGCSDDFWSLIRYCLGIILLEGSQIKKFYDNYIKWAKLQLDVIDGEIKVRNEKLDMPYTFMEPSKIPNI